MKRRIDEVSPQAASKIMAILYFVFTLLFVPIGLIMMLAGKAPFSAGLFFILAPVIYGAIGYIFVYIGCWVYNFIAKRVGGIEFTVSDVADKAGD